MKTLRGYERSWNFNIDEMNGNNAILSKNLRQQSKPGALKTVIVNSVKLSEVVHI